MRRSTPSSPSSRDSVPPRAQLLVMAKYPSPGSVKTRLASQIGPAAACRLYDAFVRDLSDRLAAVELPLTWAFWPPDAPFASLVPAKRSVPQAGRDLGERLEHAVGACFRAIPVPVIVIGVDSPHLDLARLREAADALASGADVVLGPAADGGYYLIGLREPSPEVFRGIAWGSSSVLAATLARARDAGMRTRLLEVTFDVDDTDGLRALRDVLARGDVALPRTLAALEDMMPRAR
jgi:rSAM/selenodomain-associated transferase 1